MTSSSDAPKEESPSSWENWAKLGFASKGIWPSNSWQQSLKHATLLHLCAAIYSRIGKSIKVSKQISSSSLWNGEWHVRLRGVEGVRWMTNVLSTMEYSEGQTWEEISRAEVSWKKYLFVNWVMIIKRTKICISLNKINFIMDFCR